MPFVTTQNAKVHYELDGDGPTLALVHGVGGDADSVFGGVVNHFTSRHRVLRPSLSGGGEPTADGVPLSVDDRADQVVAALRDTADEPSDLLGFSLGAVVAAVVAAEHPELVSRLVLVGGWVTSTGPRDRL